MRCLVWSWKLNFISKRSAMVLNSSWSRSGGQWGNREGGAQVQCLAEAVIELLVFVDVASHVKSRKVVTPWTMPARSPHDSVSTNFCVYLSRRPPTEAACW